MSTAAPHSGDGVFSLAQTLVGHTDFVGPVIYAPPGSLSDYPQGAIVTGMSLSDEGTGGWSRVASPQSLPAISVQMRP